MIRLQMIHFFLFAASCTTVLGTEATKKQAKQEFECRFAHGKIKIDGKADDESWKSAQTIDHFYLPWLRENARPARTSTKARLLWDRKYLYFFAEMEDTDLYADETERDGQTWNDDVFELFFKPAEDKPGYYEFQVNAAGTMMDMFLPRRNAGGFRRFVKDGNFHIDAKVHHDGTLNKWQDKDKGWSVEGRIPWSDFMRTGGRPNVDEQWKFALCRYDYSVDFEGPELSTCAPLSSRRYADFHRHEDYASLKFVGPSRPIGVKQNNVFQKLKSAFNSVPSKVVGSPDPPLPFRVQRVLPKLKPALPIAIACEAGSRRLLFIDQQKSYGTSRLCRTTDTPESGEYETLLELPSGGVAYSIAFHPRFAENGYVYIGWNGAIDEQPKHCFVTRYTIGRESPFKFDKESAKKIIKWKSNGHNGAAIAFGLDGMMYVTTGDGTSDSDTDLAGQRLDHLLAKVLRIDVDHPDEGRAYSIPKDNPFVGQKNVRGETWAYGFRNPWRMTVDQKTGHLWVGNNGQDLWEQIYLVKRGANYGWSVYEGSHIFYANRKLGPTPVSKPIFDHPHSEARSMTGGVVYYGKKHPSLRGAYIYGDYSTGKIWGAKLDGDKVEWHKELADSTLQISDFGLDANGELLIADHRGKDEGGFYTLVVNDQEDRSDLFPRKLSESGLFDSVKDHRMHAGVIPYTVNAPLWSDGALKQRYLALPQDSDTIINLHASRGWDLPNGTVAIKSFALEMKEGDQSSRRWIETRFLTRQEGEWVGYSYVWNKQQTDATLVKREGMDKTFRISTADGNMREQTWRYPSRTECMVCHSRAAKYVLGLSTLQMNKAHDYNGTTANQLAMLEYLGLVRDDWMKEMKSTLKKQMTDKEVSEMTATRDQRTAPRSSLFQRPPQDRFEHLVDPYDAKQDLAARARSYLHANCAQCHVGAGGGNAQMELEFTQKLEGMKVVDVEPLHHRFDIADARLIAPGEPDRSVLLKRIARRGRGQMPQLATSIVDDRAVELFRKWIAQMPKTPDAEDKGG